MDGPVYWWRCVDTFITDISQVCLHNNVTETYLIILHLFLSYFNSNELLLFTIKQNL